MRRDVIVADGRDVVALTLLLARTAWTDRDAKRFDELVVAIDGERVRALRHGDVHRIWRRWWRCRRRLFFDHELPAHDDADQRFVCARLWHDVGKRSFGCDKEDESRHDSSHVFTTRE